LSTKPPDEVKLKVSSVVQNAILASMPQLEQEGFDQSSVSISPATSGLTVIRVVMPDGKKRVFMARLSESY
jgi:hypothetical protein